jgi:cytochrome c-type biogenesis protein CcmH/NrfG
MKKIIVIAVVSIMTLIVIGCKQQEQKQQQLNYSPAAPPVQSQIDQMELAAKLAPKNAQSWIDLGNTLMDAQRFGEAVGSYEKALALDPRNVAVLVDQGTCYRGIGKFDKAEEQYRKALKIDPKYPNGHLNLGVVLGFDLNKKADAIQEFNRYLELAPSGPGADSARQALNKLSARQ